MISYYGRPTKNVLHPDEANVLQRAFTIPNGTPMDKYMDGKITFIDWSDTTKTNQAPVVMAHMGSKTVKKNSGETFIAKPSDIITDPDVGDVLTNYITSTNPNIAAYFRGDSLFIKPNTNVIGTGKVILTRKPIKR